MKKHIRNILLFLLLGAILNVAVAWGCSLLINVNQGQHDIKSSVTTPNWIVHQQMRWGAVQFTSYRSIRKKIRAPSSGQPSEIIPEWGDLAKPVMPIGEETLVFRILRVIDGRGWPKRSLWCEVTRLIYQYDSISSWSNDNRTGIGTWSGPLGGLETKLPQWPRWQVPVRGRWFPLMGNYPRVLPYRPIWSGFIFNTLFYAIPLWLLFPGRYMWRRRRRIRRGQCGQCGYIIAPNIGVPGASPNCPECGTPIPQKSIQPSAIILEETDHES